MGGTIGMSSLELVPQSDNTASAEGDLGGKHVEPATASPAKSRDTIKVLISFCFETIRAAWFL